METIDSKAIKSKGISQDLIPLLEKLEMKMEASKTKTMSQVLIYIDATNGNLFCSGFDQESQETIDETMICFNLTELWEHLDEEGYGAMDFDVISEKSIKKAFKSKVGKRLRSNFKVVIETEEGDQTILK